MNALRLVVCERITPYGSDFDFSRVRAKSLELHNRAISTAKRYLRSESDLIDIFEELENDKTYLEFGETSIYQYAQRYLNLSESVICHFTSIVRKSKTVPELKEAIREGAISVSKARKIVPVLTPENKDIWLEFATSSTSKQIEKAVATENPQLIAKESIKYKTSDRLELKLGVSEEWSELLKTVKDLASQKLQRVVDTEEALKLAMECFCDRHDPLEKSRRAKTRLEKKEAKPSLPVSRPAKRRPLNAALKHAVMWRDQRRCSHVNQSGVRCAERRWLDVHHIKPVHAGGSDTLENLMTLCGQHHAMRHR